MKVSLKCHSFSSGFFCVISFLFLFVCALFMVVFLKIIFSKAVLLYSVVGNHFSFSGLEEEQKCLDQKGREMFAFGQRNMLLERCLEEKLLTEL